MLSKMERLSEPFVAKIPGSTHRVRNLPFNPLLTIFIHVGISDIYLIEGQIPHIPAICDHFSPSENLCWLASFIVQVLLCLPQLVQASAVINICSKYIHFMICTASFWLRVPATVDATIASVRHLWTPYAYCSVSMPIIVWRAGL